MNNHPGIVYFCESRLKSWPFRKFRDHGENSRCDVKSWINVELPKISQLTQLPLKKWLLSLRMFSRLSFDLLGDMTKDICLVQTFESSRFFPENFMAFNSFHGKFLTFSKVASFQNSILRAIVLESLNFRWWFLSFTPLKVKALSPKFKSNRDWWNLPKSPNSSWKKNSDGLPVKCVSFLHSRIPTLLLLMVQKFG